MAKGRGWHGGGAVGRGEKREASTLGGIFRSCHSPSNQLARNEHLVYPGQRAGPCGHSVSHITRHDPVPKGLMFPWALTQRLILPTAQKAGMPECRVQRGVSGWLKVPQAGGGREQVTSMLPDPQPRACRQVQSQPGGLWVWPFSSPQRGQYKPEANTGSLRGLYVPSPGHGLQGGTQEFQTFISHAAPRRRPSCPGRGQRRTSAGGREGGGLCKRELSAPTPSKEGLWEPEAWGEGPLRLLPWGRGRGGEEWGPADSGISGCGHHDRPRASEVARPRPAVGPGAHPCCPGTGHKQESPEPPQLPGQPPQEAPHLSRRPELEGAPGRPWFPVLC